MIRGNVQDTSDDEFMRRGTSERQERIDNIKKNRIISELSENIINLRKSAAPGPRKQLLQRIFNNAALRKKLPVILISNCLI